MRPTTPARADEPAEDPAEATDQAGDGEGRGDANEPRPTRARRKRTPASSGPAKGRKVHLSDDIHDRLWLLARQRRTTVSAVAAEILDRNLPRFRVEREP